MRLNLRELSSNDEEILVALHHWSAEETQSEWFTCRPVTPVSSPGDYLRTVKSRLKQREIRLFVLGGDDQNTLYGKVTAFDYNPRNQSAEFGYYLPEIHRGKGYGNTAVKAFLDTMFQDNDWRLNKLYATTASGNAPSVQLLEHFGFHRDGVMREHYWIGDEVQDQLHYSMLKREYKASLC